jgi:hypothetical protein
MQLLFTLYRSNKQFKFETRGKSTSTLRTEWGEYGSIRRTIEDDGRIASRIIRSIFGFGMINLTLSAECREYLLSPFHKSSKVAKC